RPTGYSRDLLAEEACWRLSKLNWSTSGSGPPIVYVLGWMTHLESGFNSPVYDNESLLATSSRDNTFLRYDGRGFGLSDRDVEDLSVQARVSDLEAVVEAAGLKRFGILAASSGGAPAIVFAAEHPELVTRLVVGGFGAADSGGHTTEASTETASRMLDLFEVAWEQPQVRNMFASFILSPTGDEVDVQVLGELFRRCCSGPNVANYFRVLGSFDVRDYARRIAVPTLVINARDDQVTPLDSGRQLAALIEGSKFIVVEGGHREGTASTAEVRRLALEFLSAQLPDGD
ncbi:MAG: alpha/beta hydrolase, partial [Gammaproteobacteria bacterium]